MTAAWMLSALVAIPASAWLVERVWLRHVSTGSRATHDAAQGLVSSVRAHADAIRFTAALFPPIAIVGLVLTFIGKAYVVQSQSMVPGLIEGDVVIAVRYELGWSAFGSRHRIGKLREVQRGDVLVFRYPPDPRQIYVKRVLALPGDAISYRIDSGFAVNGKPIASEGIEKFHFYETGLDYPRYVERLDGARYEVITYNADHRPASIDPSAGLIDAKSCQYTPVSLSCRVPEGAYFAVGDNRDRSEDSRVWGFVPDEDLLGRVVARLGGWTRLHNTITGTADPEPRSPR